ncbi:MAG TPA: cytochrome c-type biogenesis CcmF C-terminal domain-containing protein, partial [Rhizomicrobium sp.]|jgi:cytochrome c-type biogenesis protein CcmF|nr:cytochrome c-type biogenesis CcmF C-terminal domain-containing protein [Rhizomicrobium sp.]
LAAWVIAASIIDLVSRAGFSRNGFFSRLRLIPLSAVASVVAHCGLGVTLIGIAGTTLWRSETLVLLAPNETAIVGPYTLRFDGVTRADGPNFVAARANIVAMRGENVIATLHPEKRLYPTEQQEVTDTAIRTNGISDLYAALGDDRGGGKWTVRAYFNPLAPFIWFGGAIMALGGMASFWGRRNRKSAAEFSTEEMAAAP